MTSEALSLTCSHNRSSDKKEGESSKAADEKKEAEEDKKEEEEKKDEVPFVLILIPWYRVS